MIVLACEGPSEVQLITELLNNNLLIFSKKEILDRRPIHLRQPKTISALIDTLPIEEELVFYRIGDTQKEIFDVSYFSIRNTKVLKICTKPEIEILVIINEGLYKDYLKVSNKISPKEYIKNKSISFKDYIIEHDMCFSIREYKRIKKHKRDELYLADYLR